MKYIGYVYKHIIFSSQGPMAQMRVLLDLSIPKPKLKTWPKDGQCLPTKLSWVYECQSQMTLFFTLDCLQSSFISDADKLQHAFIYWVTSFRIVWSVLLSEADCTLLCRFSRTRSSANGGNVSWISVDCPSPAIEQPDVWLISRHSMLQIQSPLMKNGLWF